MKITLNIPKWGTVLTLALIGYQSIAAMQLGGPLPSSVVAMGMVIVSILAFFFLFRKPLQLRSPSIILLVYYFYIVTISLLNGYLTIFLSSSTLVIACAFWIFVFWMMEECGRYSCIEPQIFANLFFALMVVCFLLFCRYYTANQNSDSTLSGLNVVYYILFMFPIVLMNDNKIFANAGIALTVLAVLLSSKRGAFLSVCVALGIWFWTDLAGKVTVKKILKAFSYVVLCIVAVFAVSAIVNKMGLDILDRMSLFISGEDAGGSGRTEIWLEFWNHMRDDSFLSNIFGRGYNSTKQNPTLKGLGMSWAHNDFLQILFDYGIIGLTLFVVFIIRLFKTAKRMKKFGYRFYRQFLISLFIFLLCCLYSMVTLNPQWLLSMAAFWGFLIGDFERERIVKKQ